MASTPPASLMPSTPQPACDDEQQAFDAATAIFEGREALEAFGFTP